MLRELKWFTREQLQYQTYITISRTYEHDEWQIVDTNYYFVISQ